MNNAELDKRIEWCRKKLREERDKPYGFGGKKLEGYDTAMKAVRSAPVANVAPKSEVDKARLDAYERGKRDAANEIRKALYKEIIEARNSNFEAIKERETKHNVNRYEDTFCYYCDGKIHALDGISYFVDELLKKYTEEK